MPRDVCESVSREVLEPTLFLRGLKISTEQYSSFCGCAFGVLDNMEVAAMLGVLSHAQA